MRPSHSPPSTPVRLLIDEHAGRAEADGAVWLVTGTVGVLAEAHRGS